jgi:3-dehydroquinate synthase
MEILTVALGPRSYSIHVGSGVLERVDLLLPHLAQPRAVLVSNETVAPLWQTAYAHRLREAGCEIVEIILPDGERFKDWRTLNRIFDALIEHGCERETTLVALGGGVVGDITGFAAACFLRGAPVVQIPTSLLAQVDSSVGGKTAINHPLGKNMIGAFHQPRLVLIDPESLRTLPGRELSAGLAEVIKYGLIRDLPFLEWLEGNIEKLLAKDVDALEQAICRSCRNKAEIVAADECERGERALLNLGHTFGHAIETGLGYGEWLHGEAVAAGTMMALELSRRLGWLDAADLARAEALFARAALPVQGPAMGAGRYLELMRRDKKSRNGELRLVVLQEIGRAVVCEDAPPAAIRDAIVSRSNGTGNV